MTIEYPKISNPEKFEYFIRDLFNKIEGTNSFHLFGRRGQTQFGVDIILQTEIAIQCKVHIKQIDISKIKEEIKTSVKNSIASKVKFKKFIFCTTYDNDSNLEILCNELSDKYNITVEYWGWQTITSIAEKHRDILKEYYPQFFVQEQNKTLIGNLFKQFFASTYYDKLNFISTDEIKLITANYIQTRFTTKDYDDLDNFIFNSNSINALKFLKKQCLQNKTNKDFFLILADLGMGKTTFMLKLYASLNKAQILKRKKRNIVFIPFGDNWGISVDNEIRKIKNPQNTILLLDAFDEDIIAKKDYNFRFEDISKKTNNFFKVIISARKQIFPDAIATNRNAYKANIVDPSLSYSYDKYFILPFDKNNIKSYLQKKYPLYTYKNYKKRKAATQIIANCTKLMSRPLLLSYIDYLLEGKSINPKDYRYANQIYDKIIDKWTRREASKITQEKDLLDPQKVDLLVSQYKKFFFKLAEYLYNNRDNGLAIKHILFKDLIDDFKINLSLDTIKSRSLLTRNAKGEYMFSHKSILEYLLAKLIYMGNLKYSEFDFAGFEQVENFYSEIYFTHSIEPLRKKFGLEGTITTFDNELHSFHFLKYEQIKNIKEIENLDIAYKDKELDLTVLSGLVNLKVLRINSYKKFKLINTQILTNFKHLEILEIKNKQIDNFDFLLDLEHLKELEISKCDFKYTDKFSNLKNLKILKLHNNSIKNIKFIENLKNLKTLILLNNQISDISYLSNLKKLEYLDIAKNKITNIAPLNKLPNLKWLSIIGNDIDNLYPLKNANKLATIYLSGNNKLSNFQILNNLHNLKKIDIDLSNGRLKSFNLVHLQKLDDIALNISNNNISDISRFINLPISFLNASNNSISNLSGLEKNDKLRTLNLANNQIKNIDNLANIKKLSSFDLSKNNISEINVFIHFTKLFRVNLSHNKIIDLSPLKNLTSLFEINVSNNLINNLDFLLYFKDFDRFPNKINVSNNQISDISILKAIKKEHRMINIDLSYNNIEDLSVIKLLKDTFLEIDLSFNKIKSLQALLKLKNTYHIKCLNITGNMIDIEEIEEFKRKHKHTKIINDENYTENIKTDENYMPYGYL